MQICPLCHGCDSTHFFDGRDHQYFHCGNCDLVFAAPDQLLEKTEEKQRYEQHNNDPQDSGYRQFLSRIIDPLLPYLHENSKGLDFGCGPGPTISVILKEKGVSCKNYDPLFFPNQELLKRKYDFITCTEACEHFYDPKKEFEVLFSLLKDQGVLGIMTETRVEDRPFANWYYKDDPTHVCFYSLKTFEYLQKTYGLQMLQVHKNAFLFFIGRNNELL